jgi:hypothetical protein
VWLFVVASGHIIAHMFPVIPFMTVHRLSSRFGMNLPSFHRPCTFVDQGISESWPPIDAKNDSKVDNPEVFLQQILKDDWIRISADNLDLNVEQKYGEILSSVGIFRSEYI